MNSPGARGEAGTVSQPRLASESGESLRPVGCATGCFPLRPPGRGGHPVLALWPLSPLQGEAGPCAELRRGQADASKISSSDCNSRHSSRLLGIRLGSGFAFVRIHDPSFDKRPPKDTGLRSRDPTGLPGRDPPGAKGKAGLGGGGRTLLAAAGLHPGVWSASHRPLQRSQHAGSVPAQWDCRRPMPQAADGSKTVLEA